MHVLVHVHVYTNVMAVVLMQFLYVHVGPSPPTNLMAVQEGFTSIRVSWTPSSDATGYIISYTGGGGSDSVTVSGGSTETHILEGLMNGVIYTISIVATLDGSSSTSVMVMNIGLGKFVSGRCTTHKPPLLIPWTYITYSSRPAKYHESNSHCHLHLPLLECSQWLSGDQFRGDVAERYHRRVL